MADDATAGEWLRSLPNTHYMTVIGGLLFVVGFGLDVYGSDVVGGLSATLGVFFIIIGLLSFGIFELLGWIETTRT